MANLVIVKSPLRISFVGGGSDLKAYCDKSIGMVVSTTISPSVYVVVKDNFEPVFRAAYRKVEEVPSPRHITHDLVREALEYFEWPREQFLEITSFADLPAGLGLGSSSSFTVALVRALRLLKTPTATAYWESTVHIAYDIESNRSGRNAGYQDACAAACGGLAVYTFNAGNIETAPIDMSREVKARLNDNLLLLRMETRETPILLLAQSDHIRRDPTRIRGMVSLAHDLATSLRSELIDDVGWILKRAWALKRTMVGVTNPQIERYMSQGLEAGGPVAGGKLLGAGGGGCMLFYAPRNTHADIVEATGLTAIPFDMTERGATVVYTASA